MPTQREIIVAYLEARADWTPGYVFNRIDVPGMGWLSHNASRRARELAQEGVISSRINDEGEVEYLAARDQRQGVLL